jgi:hypothetical protein
MTTTRDEPSEAITVEGLNNEWITKYPERIRSIDLLLASNVQPDSFIPLISGISNDTWLAVRFQCIARYRLSHNFHKR